MFSGAKPKTYDADATFASLKQKSLGLIQKHRIHNNVSAWLN